MLWRFQILNRINEPTVIEEPVGWDKNASEINRDLEKHGIFFNTQGTNFEFYEVAERLLKAEYDEYGAQGNMTLIMEEDCGNGYEEFDRGKFNFLTYDHFCGEKGCYVKIQLESSDEIMEFRNRINQKVNLETTKAFDQTTNLPAYTKLPFDLILPSKGILLQNKFQQDKDFTTPVLGVPQNNNGGSGPSTFNSEFGMIELGFDNQVAAEIGNAGTNSQLLYDCVLTSAGTLGCNSLNRFTLPATAQEIAPLDISPVVDYADGAVNFGQVSGLTPLQIQLLGSITSLNCEFNGVYFILATLPKNKSGINPADYIYHDVHTFQSGAETPIGTTISLNYNYNNPLFQIHDGDRLYAFFAMFHRRQNMYAGTNAFTMSLQQTSKFYMSTLSHTGWTTSKVFAINEVISRVTETITNNKLKAYSNYFGRTDSQPYSQPYDGCGSLEVVVDGLRVRRQENKIPGTTNLFTLSIQDIFNGLNPIHNIGMGLEKDTFRPGFNRLRVESWDFFYKMKVIMQCRDVNIIERKVYEKEIYSTFQAGYNRWEAEEYNGLDEFLTKRYFRTTLSQLQNDFVKISTMVASGYALEVTRRKGNEDSKDWRYDKETFIICCRRGGLSYSTPAAFTSATNSFNVITNTPSFFVVGNFYSISNTANNNLASTQITNIVIIGNSLQIYLSSALITEAASAPLFTDITPNKISVELGNISSPENVIDPDTLINYRISPLRNAMRWMNRVFESYRKFDANAKIIFTDGEANYYASGEMTSADCKIENKPIAENVTIDISIYKDQHDAKPFLLPERVIYEYPMSSKEFKDVAADPYGLIFFKNDCEEGFGFIDKVTYKPEEGTANFNLIPAITELLPDHIRIITEDGHDIVNEDGPYWIPENN